VRAIVFLDPGIDGLESVGCGQGEGGRLTGLPVTVVERRLGRALRQQPAGDARARVVGRGEGDRDGGAGGVLGRLKVNVVRTSATESDAPVAELPDWETSALFVPRARYCTIVDA
jgi:hypothetical protein